MTRQTTVIIGGGLAGLTAAAYLARAGRRVTILERSQTLGGRAATHEKNGYFFNLGPHALFRSAAGAQILNDLGVTYRANPPGLGNAWAIAGGKRHKLPGTFGALVTTTLLDWRGKLELAGLLRRLPKLETSSFQSVTVEQWLAETIRRPDVRDLLRAMFRLTGYANAPGRQSAGAALDQFKTALTGGVLYLDGGWQTLVNGLRDRAREFGATIQPGARVEKIVPRGDGYGVVVAGEAELPAETVVIAAGPGTTAALVDAPLPRTWAETRTPVMAACLDVALGRLPRPDDTFALGIDRPLYFSVHSASATLAPEGGAVIHAAKYLDPDGPRDAKADERELEGVLDLIQPGWREAVVERRFLPALTVTHGLVAAAEGGTRPGPAVPGLPNLYVAGDWVGNEGQLADAAFASGREAARLILTRRRQEPVVEHLDAVAV